MSLFRLFRPHREQQEHDPETHMEVPRVGDPEGQARRLAEEAKERQKLWSEAQPIAETLNLLKKDESARRRLVELERDVILRIRYRGKE